MLHLASQQSRPGTLIKDLVWEDSSFDLSSTVAEMKLRSGSVLNAIVADDLSDVLPNPFAKLLVGKTVKSYGWPTSRRPEESVDVDPPVPVEVYMRGQGRRLGRTDFTDGSSFVDGGVGARCGPPRYLPAPEEDDDILRSYGLTNTNTGIASDRYWIQVCVVEAREASNKAYIARMCASVSRMCATCDRRPARMPYNFCGGRETCLVEAE